MLTREIMPIKKGVTGGVATCIGCGCDDYHACYDVKAGHSCYWLRPDRKSGLGVCSCCEYSVEAWDAGSRKINVAHVMADHTAGCGAKKED